MQAFTLRIHCKASKPVHIPSLLIDLGNTLAVHNVERAYIRRIKKRPKNNQSVQPTPATCHPAVAICEKGSEKAEAKRPSRREYQRQLERLARMATGEIPCTYMEVVLAAHDALKLARK